MFSSSQITWTLGCRFSRFSWGFSTGRAFSAGRAVSAFGSALGLGGLMGFRGLTSIRLSAFLGLLREAEDRAGAGRTSSSGTS